MAPAGANISSDRRNFFMSSAQLEALEKKEQQEQDPVRQQLGSPIRTKARVLGFELCDKDTAVLALASHQAKVADLKAAACVKAAVKHAGPVTSVAVLGAEYRAKGSRIAMSASWDKVIKVWAVDDPQRTLAVLTGHSDFVKCLVAHPTMPIIYSGSADKSIMFWRLPESAEALLSEQKPLEIAPFKVIKGEHTGQIYTLCLDSTTASTLYSAGSDASIRAWDSYTGVPLAATGHDLDSWHIARGQHKTNIFDCKLTENELWTASADKTAVCWDLETRTADIVLEHSTAVTAVLPIPQMGVVVTGVRDGAIYVWRISSGSPVIIREIHAHTDDVTCLRAAGRIFYSSGLDETLRKWDIKDVVEFSGGLEYIPAELKERDEQQSQTFTTATSTTNPGHSALTEEEERELAELMSDLDD
ncbi:WD40 repeat-like protein [Coemansia reversa NRRL 1564]|uniref:WD40 repeat-like protein n=1 Tax=Coemansia reversa (strain ATCC 12441 / NRRL 1564) TaxID=763665 RepID=A0A2G5BG92_COERN|nr:WD40 repeat-like protein [Coemansia reversa NRRL 1564]|eukprot:PIA18044.1 WD40 repeat-like protein [Coemansia reversa NRRL 1564]